MGRLGLGGSHSAPCSASSPKEEEPSKEAEPKEAAKPEVSGQAREGGLEACKSRVQTPEALVLPLGPQEQWQGLAAPQHHQHHS